MGEMRIDRKKVEQARSYAGKIADGVLAYIDGCSTTSIERTVLRVFGIDGTDSDGVPLANAVVDHLLDRGLLEKGAAYYMALAVLDTGLSPQEVAEQVAAGSLDMKKLPKESEVKIKETGTRLTKTGLARMDRANQTREGLRDRLGTGQKPWLYVIVATGDIYEDIVQAKAAAAQGADIVAVIRSTAQSLLDYVPYGPTREGFGGTYATQENFRLMRQALNEVSKEQGRYVSLVNYASGLCMPEITAMAVFEGLDMLLNDALYGILFRDINMKRTLIDQQFSRMICARYNIIINTGEDNYLTTADALEAGHTVLASELINEQLALRAGLVPELLGLGHAFEINPDVEDGLLYEIAQAQLIRQVFPRSPLKYMPPTKYMTGNIFRGYLQNGLFNLVSVLTGQEIQLLGMLTEAIHTPFLQDRFLAIKNASYVFNNARHLKEEVLFKQGGIIEKRADKTIDETLNMLGQIHEIGLIKAIEAGMFADISRKEDGGKGLDGVFKKHPSYFNPVWEELSTVEEGLEYGS